MKPTSTLATARIYLVVFCLCFLFSGTLLRAQWKRYNYSFEGAIEALTVCGTTLFAENWTNGLYRSTDNGDNWTLVNNGMENHQVLTLAVVGDKVLFAGTAKGVYRSTDNGNNWVKSNNGLKEMGVRCLAVQGETVFAGIDGEGVFRSDDNGNSWIKILNEGNIRSISVVGTKLYVGVLYRFYLSRDKGNNWINLNTNRKQSTVRTVKLVGTTLFAIALFDDDDDGVFRSDNEGFTWTKIDYNFTAKRSAWSLVVIGTTLFVGTHGGGVIRSNNDGKSWEEMNDGLSNYSKYIYTLIESGTTLLAGTDDRGIWKYENATSVPEEVQPQAVSITPNPVSATVTISGLEGVAAVNLVNSLGVVVNRQLLVGGKTTIDVSDVASGMYFVQFHTQTGMISKAIVVLH